MKILTWNRKTSCLKSFQRPRFFAAADRLKKRNDELVGLAKKLGSTYAPQTHVQIIVPTLVAGVPCDSKFGTSLLLFEGVISDRVGLAHDASISIIDVSDVARLITGLVATKSTADQPDVIEAATHTIYFSQLMETVDERLEKKRKVRIASSSLIRLVGVFSPKISVVASYLGKHAPADSSFVKKTLRGDVVPVEQTINETVDFLLAK